MKKLIILSLCLLFTISLPTKGQIRLASIFKDHMVLQQNSKVNVWGWGTPGSKFKMVGEWNLKDTIVVPVDNWGRWKTQIQTNQAGGPYEIRILDSGSSTVILKDVMLGEVWLCSGQSNMEWTYNHKLGNPEKEIPAANYPNIRIFTVDKVASANQQDLCEGRWEACTPDVMKRSSAVAYFYARQLHKQLNVPIGVIVSCWGGTNAETWLEDSIVKTDSELKKASSLHIPYAWWPYEPGVCYNAMIHPLVPYTLAGFIWYQGEANVGKGIFPVYDKLMRKLISSWRNDFGKDLPFYFVQIAPFNYNKDSYANYLREQQAQTALYPNTKMIVISDLLDGNVNNIHPLNKWDVGDRLANLALTYTYGIKGRPHLYPRFEKMEIKGRKAYLSFKDSPGIEIRGKKIRDLQVAGSDSIFVDAEAKVVDGKLVVWSRNVKDIKAVRYAFTNTAIGNLFSTEGLPVIPFRTDSFNL
ncbi:sialate O-acetylesterase [uncultured Mediterranea sp.]|uniref:sialate O-acetylesterase n=1 Tax=uncultured Mediterranea sp. TaxID=1926662 RepID=UPI0027D97568|nr:sialate O-acetylesterase [uncultured Mediterranea sp.]